MFVIPENILAFLNNTVSAKGALVVGVSGGADSLYLTYLLNEWCRQKKRTLLAVTVNHDLRAEAAEEAEQVHEWLNAKGISHHTLVWQGAKPKTKVEEKAREKRYELLLDFCHRHKAAALFLAHHRQDQAETFWARLARGSGLDGLSAMAPCSYRDGIMLLRPLLTTPKQEIIQTLKKNRLPWVEDPMNQDEMYERVRWRKNQAKLDEMGLSAEVVEKSVQRLARAKKALENLTQKFLVQTAHFAPQGFISLDLKAFKEAEEEIRVRALIHLIKLLQPKDKIVSLESVEKIALEVPKHATLNGCQWVVAHHKIFLARELKHCKSALLPANSWVQWGAVALYSTMPFMAETGAPSPRAKNIPYLIQRTFLKIPKDFQCTLLENFTQNAKKELEKKQKLDYKNNTPHLIMGFYQQKENV